MAGLATGAQALGSAAKVRPSAGARRVQRRLRPRGIANAILTYTLLVLITLFAIAPLAWAMSSAFKSDTEILTEADPVETSEDELDEDAYTYDVEVMWGDDADEVEPVSVALLDDDGDVVAKLGRRRLLRTIERPARTTRKGDLRIRGHRRATFFGLRLAGVKASKLRVRYRMTEFRGRGARVTTQISGSRRRR